MRRVIIFGNSASGKSTLAKRFAEQGLAHLDLDTLAWDMTPQPVRRDKKLSCQKIDTFTQKHNHWVIEGCYSDLLAHVLEDATEVIFMNLPIDLCIINAKRRPWESHKYASKSKQDANLTMLIDWISLYGSRSDEFSLQAHQALFDKFTGKKSQIIDNTIVNID